MYHTPYFLYRLQPLLQARARAHILSCMCTFVCRLPYPPALCPPLPQLSKPTMLKSFERLLGLGLLTLVRDVTSLFDRADPGSLKTLVSTELCTLCATQCVPYAYLPRYFSIPTPLFLSPPQAHPLHTPTNNHTWTHPRQLLAAMLTHAPSCSHYLTPTPTPAFVSACAPMRSLVCLPAQSVRLTLPPEDVLDRVRRGELRVPTMIQRWSLQGA